MAGTVTISTAGNESAMGRCVTGSVAVSAHATATNVSIGFIPKVVFLFNDSGTDTFTFWCDAQGESEGAQVGATAGFLGAAAIAAYAGSGSASSGFTIAAGAMLADTDDIYFIAWR